MLVLANGAVIPHVGAFPRSEAAMMPVFASYARRGSKLDALLINCWSRGLSAYDTNIICSVNGYALCVAELRRRQVWANWDAGWAAHCASNPDIAMSDKNFISF